MTPKEFLAYLDAQAAAAADVMAAAADGASLCSVSRSGARVPGVKYQEGRWAALRAARRPVLEPGVDVARALADLRQVWAADLEHRRARSQDNWISYRLGGIDAIDEAVERWG